MCIIGPFFDNLCAWLSWLRFIGSACEPANKLILVIWLVFSYPNRMVRMCVSLCMYAICLPAAIVFVFLLLWPILLHIICPLSFCFCYCSCFFFVLCVFSVLLLLIVDGVFRYRLRNSCCLSHDGIEYSWEMWCAFFSSPSIVYFNLLLCRECICVWDWVVTVAFVVVLAIKFVKVRSLSVYESYHFTKDTFTYLQLTRRENYKFEKKKNKKRQKQNELQNSSTYENEFVYFACVYSLKQRYLHFDINYILCRPIHLFITLSLSLTLALSHTFMSFYSCLFFFSFVFHSQWIHAPTSPHIKNQKSKPSQVKPSQAIPKEKKNNNFLCF